jgi:uncharacterized protein YndB with AHSA1/START domain/DNA-binding transcriptional ArsR family regulator
MAEDDVFKALADPHRRLLLDSLFQRDGQTLSELEALLPMTRFGAMKHLNVLEDAGLISTRKVGREKLHYLNPVPVQEVYERWVSKYAQPWTSVMTGLKHLLEEPTMTTAAPAHVYHTYIRTTPEKLWQALTDGAMTARYYFGTAVQSTWEQGAAYTYLLPDGTRMIDGEIVQIDPPDRLVQTFRPLWAFPDGGAPESTVTWEIEQQGDFCRLTLIHEGIDLSTPLAQGMVDGWARIISGMKTLLETGVPAAMAVF